MYVVCECGLLPFCFIRPTLCILMCNLIYVVIRMKCNVYHIISADFFSLSTWTIAERIDIKYQWENCPSVSTFNDRFLIIGLAGDFFFGCFLLTDVNVWISSTSHSSSADTFALHSEGKLVPMATHPSSIPPPVEYRNEKIYATGGGETFSGSCLIMSQGQKIGVLMPE